MSRFQLIFTGLLVILGIGGAILFAVSKNTSNQGAAPTVIWGTLDSQLMSSFLSKANSDNQGTMNVSYVQKAPAAFESDLIAALARGGGPDMVLLPQDFIVKQIDKFYLIPFSAYSERTFKSSFIQEGELYLVPASQASAGGIVGFPFSIDPLVMYWNRDLFSNAGLAVPPSSWTQMFDLVPKLTVRDGNGNIAQSLIAFGEARNVAHYKDILALLSLQASSPLAMPSEQALSYFTEFSNPTKASYSWNRSLPLDRNAFVAGKLALYFGYASELGSIRAANPNLNFDVAAVPQASAMQKKVAFGSMSAIAILRSSKNIAASFAAASALTGPTLEGQWVNESGFAPVRRDLLTTLPGDAYKAVFYQSALIASAWLDPNREATNDIFLRLVENVTSGRLRVSESVNGARQEINNLIQPGN